MENCLVTKYKGTVSADLPVYGEISFDIPASTAFFSFDVGCLGGDNTIKCTGDVEVWSYDESVKRADAGNPYTLPSTLTTQYVLRVKSGSQGGRLIITDKYNMNEEGYCDSWFRFKPTYFDTLDGYKPWFKGYGNLVNLTSSTASGTFEELAELVSGIRTVVINANCNISGNITGLSSHKKTITNITLATPNNGIEASMEDLGVFTALTTLSDYRTIYCNIEDLVRSLIANGKTTGSINAVFAPGHKFNGVNVEQSASALTWTSTTATYKGVTVNL